MDCEYSHWGTTAEVMEIIRRREKSPETRRLFRSLKEVWRSQESAQ